MDYEAAVHDMLSIGAGLTSREWVDARGAHNDLACAFVFLVKPAGPPSTVDKEPESTTAPAPSRGRGTSRVTRRRLGHGASVRLQRRARCSRRRGWGCTFKPGTEPTTTATLRRCRARRDVRAASDASGGRPLDADLRGAEEPICTHVSPRVHCNRCACAVDEKPINYRGMHGEHVRHNEEVSLQLIDVSANGTFAAELLRLSTIGCHDATDRATSIKEPCPS